MNGPDDKTPARIAPVSAAAVQFADAALALSTVATRLRAAADLAEAAAVRSAEAARLVDGDGGGDDLPVLLEYEDLLGELADGVHDTRRAVRTARMALEYDRKGKRP